MSYEPAVVIEVLAWGRRVGAVALNPATGWYSFAYTPEWVDGGIELAPLHMGLRLAPYEFPQLRRETFYGLPPLLADSSMPGWPSKAWRQRTSRRWTASRTRRTAPWEF
jgi:serine/threonine-protein kinase HipA